MAHASPSDIAMTGSCNYQLRSQHEDGRHPDFHGAYPAFHAVGGGGRGLRRPSANPILHRRSPSTHSSTSSRSSPSVTSHSSSHTPPPTLAVIPPTAEAGLAPDEGSCQNPLDATLQDRSSEIQAIESLGSVVESLRHGTMNAAGRPSHAGALTAALGRRRPASFGGAGSISLSVSGHSTHRSVSDVSALSPLAPAFQSRAITPNTHFSHSSSSSFYVEPSMGINYPARNPSRASSGPARSENAVSAEYSFAVRQPRGPVAEAELDNQNFANRIRKRAIGAILNTSRVGPVPVNKAC